MDEDKPEETKPEETHTEPEKPPEVPPAHDGLRETVNALSEKVTALENTVTSMLPQNRDETPVKKPWTHRGFK